MQSGENITQEQRRLLVEFYRTEPQKVALDKAQRKKLWELFKQNRDLGDFMGYKTTCPALFLEVEKAVTSGKNIQPAVFSECVYSQALAEQYGLTEFAPASEANEWLPARSLETLASIGMHVRYLFRNSAQDMFLVQAGGHAGVDCALIFPNDEYLVAIEFKEPGSKASEPDLPPYGEDGSLAISTDFLNSNPQFSLMIQEQISKDLNFFDHIGNNINNFSPASIEKAVTENYAAKKQAAAICTEDLKGILTLIPIGQVHKWARLEGEIRPAGRNDYPVWTPRKLISAIESIGGTVDNGAVEIPMQNLTLGKQRGGSSVSRVKINSIFFARTKHVEIDSATARFALKDVRQLRPTITAKMFFDGLDYGAVKHEYIGGS